MNTSLSTIGTRFICDNAKNGLGMTVYAVLGHKGPEKAVLHLMRQRSINILSH